MCGVVSARGLHDYVNNHDGDDDDAEAAQCRYEPHDRYHSIDADDRSRTALSRGQRTESSVRDRRYK